MLSARFSPMTASPINPTSGLCSVIGCLSFQAAASVAGLAVGRTRIVPPEESHYRLRLSSFYPVRQITQSMCPEECQSSTLRIFKALQAVDAAQDRNRNDLHRTQVFDPT